MDDERIRKELDELVDQTTTFNEAAIPHDLLENLKKWKWGKYGWVSPASLMFTAAWRKYYYPDVDCCKIWASDENNKPIPGGYSIRSEDEGVSIPILAKHDLCEGFCSPNSGMQGSRAIEKMRTLKRLNTDFDTAQRTLFDLKLFANIMNQINNLNKEQLLEVLRYFICTAKAIKAIRIETNKTLNQENSAVFNVLETLADIHDPELTKCVVAACMKVIFNQPGFNITGVDDYKTAADARARKPGDLTVEKNGTSLLAIEVKDKTQKIDWNNIERAKRIISAHPELKGFVFVLESRDAATSPLINEMVKSSQLTTGEGKIISIMSLFALYQIAIPMVSENEFVNLTSKYITEAPAIKPETKKTWLSILNKR
jgi:hypothetical protein